MMRPILIIAVLSALIVPGLAEEIACPPDRPRAPPALDYSNPVWCVPMACSTMVCPPVGGPCVRVFNNNCSDACPDTITACFTRTEIEKAIRR